MNLLHMQFQARQELHDCPLRAPPAPSRPERSKDQSTPTDVPPLTGMPPSPPRINTAANNLGLCSQCVVPAFQYEAQSTQDARMQIL